MRGHAAEKLKRYGDHLDALRRLGIKCVPLAFSSYGRLHSDAAAALETIARRAAQRRGLASHQQLLRRTQAAVGVLIWRRAAAMVHACAFWRMSWRSSSGAEGPLRRGSRAESLRQHSFCVDVDHINVLRTLRRVAMIHAFARKEYKVIVTQLSGVQNLLDFFCGMRV